MAVQVQIDASKVQSQMDIFINAVKASNAVIGEFTVKTLAFNEAGKLIGGTLEQMASGGTKVSASFDLMANAATLAGAKVTTSAKDMAQQLERLQTLAGKNAGDQARNLFPLPPDASISKITSYNNQITNLQRAVGAAGLSASQITAMFNQAANSPAQFAQRIQGLPPQLQAVGQAILAVGAQAQQAGQQGAAAGQSFLISWQGVVRIFEAQVIRRAISGLLDSLKSGANAAVDYQVQFQQVANVTGRTGGTITDFQNRVRALSDQFGTPISDVLAASQTALTGQLNDTAAGFNVLTNAMRLTQATGTDLASSTKLITSALQAFHLEGSQAGRVTEVLYQASQRSRVPIDELQAAIGRVSQTAHGLGVSFEQTVALFLTIQQQGGRPTEAFSLLNQVMGRLLQPTKELQKFLNDLGTPTAQLAVSTFGLTGVLERLSEAAAKNPAALGDLAGSVRTLRGLMAITGDQTRIFEQNLRGLSSTADNVFSGAGRVAETSGQRIRVLFNEIKNVFTQDIGQSLINNLVKITDNLGGAKAVATGFANAVVGIIGTFALYRVAAGAATIATVAYSNSLIASGVASATAGQATAALASKLNFLVIALVAAYAAYQTFNAIGAEREAARVDAIVREINAERQLSAETRERIAREGRDQQAIGTQLVNSAFAERLRVSANNVRVIHEERDATIEAHRQATADFHTQNQTILDGFRARLSEARKQKDELESLQRSTTRSASQFAQSVEAQGFQRELNLNQDPRRAIELINNRRRQVQQESQDIFQNPNSTPEQIARARELFAEEQRLNGELEKRETELQRIQALQNNNFTIEIRNGQRVRVLRLDTSAAIQRDQEIIERRNTLEAELNRTLDARIAAKKQEEAQAQLTLRLIEQQFRAQEQFTVLDQRGNIRSRFEQDTRRDSNGDSTRLREDFQRQTQQLLTTARQQGASPAQLEQIRQTEAARLVRLQEEFRSVQNVARVEAAQQATVAERNRVEAALNGLLERRVQLLQQIQQLAQNAGDSVVNQVRNLGAAGPNQANNTSFSEEYRARIRDAIAKYNEFRTATDNVRTAQQALAAPGGQTAANILRYREAVDRATAAQREFIALSAGRNGDAGDGQRLLERAGISPDKIDLIRRLGTDARNGLPALDRIAHDIGQIAVNDLSPVNENIRGLAANLGTANTNAAGLASQLTAAVGFTNNGGPALVQQMQDVAAAIGQGARNMRGLLEAGREFAGLFGGGAPAIPAAPAQAAGNNWMGGPVGYRASGGMTGSHPGGPRGTDTMPYWLSPGEFVVNAHSTGKFYSQLLAINSGHQPKYAAGGGPVTVGDINVNVNGGATSERTIRDIGIGISREIRRGTIRWRV